MAAAGGATSSSRTTPTNSSSSSTWIAQAVYSTCTAGFVECEDGILVSDDTTTCFADCDGNCCTYYDLNDNPVDACVGFTGKVCKDGSCNGFNASCNKKATIPSVVNSCKDYGACRFAGGYGGSIKSMVDSCIGIYACHGAAYYGGTIGNIIGSCFGEYYTCMSAVMTYGSIGDITESCMGYIACDDIGQVYGKVGNIVKSCLGESACNDTSEYFGDRYRCEHNIRHSWESKHQTIHGLVRRCHVGTTD